MMINWHSERLHHSKDLAALLLMQISHAKITLDCNLATVVLMQISRAKIILECNLCLQALVDMLQPLMPRH
jgi:hypothetical protein